MSCPVDSWDKFALPETMFEHQSSRIAAGWKTGEIDVRQGTNRSQIEHLARIRNAAWRRFSSGFRPRISGGER